MMKRTILSIIITLTVLVGCRDNSTFYNEHEASVYRKISEQDSFANIEYRFADNNTLMEVRYWNKQTNNSLRMFFNERGFPVKILSDGIEGSMINLDSTMNISDIALTYNAQSHMRRYIFNRHLLSETRDLSLSLDNEYNLDEWTVIDNNGKPIENGSTFIVLNLNDTLPINKATDVQLSLKGNSHYKHAYCVMKKGQIIGSDTVYSGNKVFTFKLKPNRVGRNFLEGHIVSYDTTIVNDEKYLDIVRKNFSKEYFVK